MYTRTEQVLPHSSFCGYTEYVNWSLRMFVYLLEIHDYTSKIGHLPLLEAAESLYFLTPNAISRASETKLYSRNLSEPYLCALCSNVRVPKSHIHRSNGQMGASHEMLLFSSRPGGTKLGNKTISLLFFSTCGVHIIWK